MTSFKSVVTFLLLSLVICLVSARKLQDDPDFPTDFGMNEELIMEEEGAFTEVGLEENTEDTVLRSLGGGDWKGRI